MVHLGMISKIIANKSQKTFNSKFIKMHRAFIKEREGKLVKNWQHMDQIFEGDILAIYDDGEKELSPINGYILLPNEDSAIGDEWFYIGV